MKYGNDISRFKTNDNLRATDLKSRMLIMADCDVPTALLTSTDREIVVNGATVEAQGLNCDVTDDDVKQSQVVGETDKMVVERKATLRRCAPHTGTPDPTASRDVISIFVVAFDSKEGNLLEWYMPQELALDGIEFRALISGAHTVTSDFIYFRQGDYYGAACFEKLTIISDIERGARMKSIGVIVSSFNALHHHLEYLAQQVRKLVVTPGDYGALEKYYQSRKALIPSSWDTPKKVPQNPILSAVNLNLTSGSAEEFTELLHLFGEQLMILWRATLLCKRILLFSAPPIGLVCSRVYCISLLSSHSTPGLPVQLLRPLFYISIADMDLLQEQHSYVACTTEKIFEEKTGICDIFVENQNVRIPTCFRHVLAITPEDRKRLLSLHHIAESSHSTAADFRSFFMELNNKIFSTMYQICNSDAAVMIDDDIGAMGLNPQLDQAFVTELAMIHGFDLTVSGSSRRCCPCDL